MNESKMPAASLLEAGVLVELVSQPEWGPGKIVHLDGKNLHIIFRDLEERTARVFRTPAPTISRAEAQTDPILDNLPPLTEKDGRWELPRARIPLAAAKQKFLRLSDDIIKLSPPLIAPFPEPDDKDRAALAARSVISLVPIVGSAATDLLSPLIGPPVEKRKDEWLVDLAGVVEAAAKTVEELSKDEVFVTTVIRTSRIALATHREEKRKLLQNVLIKVGEGVRPNEDVLEGYLQIIDEFTPSHFKLLHFLWAGAEEVGKKLGERYSSTVMTYRNALDLLVPGLANDEDFITVLMHDLNDRRLIQASSTGLLEARFPLGGLVTNRGINFLMFVLGPDQLPESMRPS